MKITSPWIQIPSTLIVVFVILYPVYQYFAEKNATQIMYKNQDLIFSLPKPWKKEKDLQKSYLVRAYHPEYDCTITIKSSECPEEPKKVSQKEIQTVLTKYVETIKKLKQVSAITNVSLKKITMHDHTRTLHKFHITLNNAQISSFYIIFFRKKTMYTLSAILPTGNDKITTAIAIKGLMGFRLLGMNNE